ncbi:MAG: hypothetical protein RMI56_03115 [Sulfolobales archaeon]|nr:hypothetical protein [Sulfolobales archaeon]MDW8082771.1 hypothetical protein [Sulfolobales archaeon]
MKQAILDSKYVEGFELIYALTAYARCTGMWLFILLAASTTATLVYFAEREYSKYLVLILWGATLMVSVDWFWGYIEEGVFVPEEAVEHAISSSLLGLTMVAAAAVLWVAAVLISKKLLK